MSAYELNKLMYDLRRADRRAAMRDDLEAYLDGYRLTDAERRLVLDRDWQGLVEAGASIYVLTKLGAVLEVSLYEMGARMRGMSDEEFWSFVKQQDERNSQHAILPLDGTAAGTREPAHG
ncbi:MAG: hypothetical protein ACRDO1_01115 [Nocardioidaceae bacterium]